MATIVSDITSVADNILKSNQFNRSQTFERLDCMPINILKLYSFYFSLASHDNILDRFAAQLKLLIDLSEQIWECLSSRNYLTATQLFQFALCIKTSKFIYI